MHSLSALYRDILGRSRDAWQSIQLTPRGNDALLAIFAPLRLLAIVAVAFRLELGRPVIYPNAFFAAGEDMFIALALVYALALLLLLLWEHRIFFSQELKLFQVIGDVLVYSGAYYLAQDPHSDIYFLNVMPLLIAIEYFSFAFAILIVFFTSVLHVMVTLWNPLPGGVLQWLGHDFSPRTFIVGLLGSAYLIHRRLRPLSDATLEHERTQLMAKLHKISRQLPAAALVTAASVRARSPFVPGQNRLVPAHADARGHRPHGGAEPRPVPCPADALAPIIRRSVTQTRGRARRDRPVGASGRLHCRNAARGGSHQGR